VCINFEHGLKDSDIQFLQRADKYNINIQIIMTKIDKIPENKYFYQLQSIIDGINRLQLSNINERMLAVSSKTNFGI